MYWVSRSSTSNGRSEPVLPLSEQINLMDRPVNRGRKEYTLDRIPCHRRDRLRELEGRQKRVGGEIPDFDRMVEGRRQDPVRWEDTGGAQDVCDWQSVV